MKRPFELVAAETERLKALLGCAADALTYETQKVRAHNNELKSLLTRAADALDKYGLSDDQKELIAELRKAAATNQP